MPLSQPGKEEDEGGVVVVASSLCVRSVIMIMVGRTDGGESSKCNFHVMGPGFFSFICCNSIVTYNDWCSTATGYCFSSVLHSGVSQRDRGRRDPCR